jgi:hypothetical protein
MEPSLGDRFVGESSVRSSINSDQNLGYTLGLVFVSAILFVTIVSLYDVVRSAIASQFTCKTEKKPTSFQAIGFFALFCVVFALVVVPLIVLMIRKA